MGTIFQDPMTLIFSIIILIIAVLAAVNLFNATSKLFKQLTSVNVALKSLTHRAEYDEDGELVELDWQPNASTIAYQNYEQMNAAIAATDCLKASWEEYQRSMQFPGVDYTLSKGQAPALRNTMQVKSLFNSSNIVESKLNVRMYTSTPNILTGLGLLFTFVGLMIGISEAAVGLSSSDIDAAKQSLNPLLSGASIAFTTSVVGLLLSMIFSVFEKAQFYKLEKAVKEFSDFLATHIDFVDADKLAAMQLQATQLQTQALADFQVDQQRITDETITRVSKEFRETLLESAGSELKMLGELIGKMNDRLEGNITRFTDSQERMQSVTEKLTHTIEDSFGKVTNQLVDTVNGMGEREDERVQAVIDNFRHVMKDIEQSHLAISEQVQLASQQATTATFEQVERMTAEVLPAMINDISSSMTSSVEGFVTRIQTTEESMSSLLSQFPTTVEMLKKMTQEVAGNIEVMGRLQSLNNGSIEQLSDMVAKLNRSSDSLVNANDKASETAQVYSIVLDSVNEAANKNIENTQCVNKAMESLKQTMASQTEHSAEMKRSLQHVFDGLRSGLEDYTQQSNNYMQSLDQYSAEITSNLVEATKELRTTVQDIAAVNIKEVA
ncbi:hypothetical protein [Photobacterium kagoshimensis]|uniref:hypothetical protein n=1 Tax=Photobacterium kagoshimensis TaxID=2910242 RepID=UPI003D12FA0C